MEIRIKTSDYEMTSDTSSYLDARLAAIEKLLGSDNTIARCEVELGRDAGRPRHGANIYFAEFTILVPGQPVVRATNRSESVSGAIDDAKEEVVRQLRRERKLHIRMWRRGGSLAKRMLRIDD